MESDRNPSGQNHSEKSDVATTQSEVIDPKLVGLRGWLILVGIGVVISPFRLLISFVPLYSEIFSDGTWETLTTPESALYDPLWAPLIIGEILFNSLIVLASAYLIYLFFSKNRLFPKFFIGIVVVSVIFIPLDAWMGSLVAPNQPAFDPETTKEFARTLVSLFIWVPYMLMSKRVKATFVHGKSLKKEPTRIAG